MAFRKKADIILKYKPDILVIPECEHPDKLIFKADCLIPSDALWFGLNKNKGLGIFSYCDYKFKLHESYNPDLRMIIPITVRGRNVNFTLYAIWANNPVDPDGQYITQVWKALRYYDNLLFNQETILIGDFNSNTIWDRPRREGNHSTVVSELEKKGIHSVYHKHFKQMQGEVQHPTLLKEHDHYIDAIIRNHQFLRSPIFQ